MEHSRDYLFNRDPVPKDLSQRREAARQANLNIPSYIQEDGTECFENKAGKLHRIGGPALIYPNGRQEYYFEGKLHRIGGPALITETGDSYWYKHGVQHRDDGPAVVIEKGPDGRTRIEYIKNGKPHREDGPAVIQGQASMWFFKGKLHRKNGPAILYEDGEEHYYQNDIRHREEGPAIITAEGEESYFLTGIKLDYSNWCSLLKKGNFPRPRSVLIIK